VRDIIPPLHAHLALPLQFDLSLVTSRPGAVSFAHKMRVFERRRDYNRGCTFHFELSGKVVYRNQRPVIAFIVLSRGNLLYLATVKRKYRSVMLKP
jgi:hypothetical protein